MSTQPEPIIVPDLLEEADRHADLKAYVDDMFDHRDDDNRTIHTVILPLDTSLCGLTDFEPDPPPVAGAGKHYDRCPVCLRLKPLRRELGLTHADLAELFEGRP